MSIPKNWPTCFIASLTKCLPLSELIFLGIPHLGTISVNRAFATAAESCFEVGKASTHFDHMSTITRQCFCFPQGVNSMKSIIRYSNGPAGAGWDAKGVFIPLATLCVLQVTHLLQKFSATTVNPFVNHNSFICIIMLPFDTWSNPCVNLSIMLKEVFWANKECSSTLIHTPPWRLQPDDLHCCFSAPVEKVCILCKQGEISGLVTDTKAQVVSLSPVLPRPSLPCLLSRFLWR